MNNREYIVQRCCGVKFSVFILEKGFTLNLTKTGVFTSSFNDLESIHFNTRREAIQCLKAFVKNPKIVDLKE